MQLLNMAYVQLTEQCVTRVRLHYACHSSLRLKAQPHRVGLVHYVVKNTKSCVEATGLRTPLWPAGKMSSWLLQK